MDDHGAAGAGPPAHGAGNGRGREAPEGADAGSVPADDAGERAMLAVVRDSVLRLATGFARPPATLRVQAGDVLVEVGWAPAVAPAGVAAAAADPGPDPAAQGDDAGDGRDYVRSPMVGRFYRAPGPGAAPFVDVGDVVAVGQQVALVETMKLMIPVHAEVAGTVVEVLRGDAVDVEHGEPLFALTPA